jgi:hypothetical protein
MMNFEFDDDEPVDLGELWGGLEDKLSKTETPM